MARFLHDLYSVLLFNLSSYTRKTRKEDKRRKKRKGKKKERRDKEKRKGKKEKKRREEKEKKREEAKRKSNTWIYINLYTSLNIMFYLIDLLIDSYHPMG